MHAELVPLEVQTHPLIDPSQVTLVCLLGGLRFVRHGQELSIALAGKATSLLVELALRMDHGARREELVETLWPEQDGAQANTSLNSLVYSLQRRLREPFQDLPVLVYEHGRYQFNRKIGIHTDVTIFDGLVRRGHQLAAESQSYSASLLFKAAVDLYHGDLCVGSTVHAVVECERLRASFLRILVWLAAHSYRENDMESATHYAHLLLANDPCREDAHRLVMRILVHRGERTEALRQFKMCENSLRREFDAVPESLTVDLFEQIRSGLLQG